MSDLRVFGGVTLDELNKEVNREVVKKLQSLVTPSVPLIRTCGNKILLGWMLKMLGGFRFVNIECCDD